MAKKPGPGSKFGRKIHVITAIDSGLLNEIEAFASPKAASNYAAAYKRRYGNPDLDVGHYAIRIRKGKVDVNRILNITGGVLE